MCTTMKLKLVLKEDSYFQVPWSSTCAILFQIKITRVNDIRTLSSLISVQHNLILFEKFVLPTCIFTYTNEKKSPTYTYFHIHKWKKSPIRFFAIKRLLESSEYLCTYLVKTWCIPKFFQKLKKFVLTVLYVYDASGRIFFVRFLEELRIL